MKIIVRHFEASQDSGLLYDSYPKGVYYGAAFPIEKPKTEFFKDFHVHTKELLESAQILIACPEEHPEFIIGYSIVLNGTLYFVYVKDVFRNKGIGTLLTQGRFTTINWQTCTKSGAAILKKHPELIGGTNEERKNDESPGE